MKKHSNNRDRFKVCYSKHLREQHSLIPQDYAYPSSELGAVIARMFSAIDKMSFNKDSISFKKTCKELGIKHTYKAIKEYLEL